VLERYVTAGELAQLMGVSVRTIKRWTAEGMPSETWGMRTRRYLASEAVAWARERGQRGTVLDHTNHRPRRLMNATAQHREE
jgi:phage terminase Nu1 subunit (DNA packaging protein)